MVCGVFAFARRETVFGASESGEDLVGEHLRTPQIVKAQSVGLGPTRKNRACNRDLTASSVGMDTRRVNDGVEKLGGFA